MGLGDLRVTSPTSASWAFGAWLDSDQYLSLVEDYRREGKEPDCLLDIITLWVMHTDALLNFPTYATFLLTILEIVNQWQRSPQYFMTFLWPLPAEADEDGLHINSLAGEDDPDSAYGRDVMSHPVMREENFLLRKATLREGYVAPFADRD